MTRRLTNRKKAKNGYVTAVRGNMYTVNESVCPKRMVTFARAKDGATIPVKTAQPVKKSDLFEAMNGLENYPHNTLHSPKNGSWNCESRFSAKSVIRKSS